jgi:hypothetical protein
MPTQKQTAKDLINSFLPYSKDYLHLEHMSGAKKCALVAVDKIEAALTSYGDASLELQNMDSEFRWWEGVRNEIKLA